MSYKIVRSTFIKGEEIFKSLTMSLFRGGVVYEVGKPTRPLPDCGPLAAFETLRDVEEFKRLRGWTHEPVFRCRIKKEIKKDNLFITADGKIEQLFGGLPPGTILCKEITLIRLIRKEEKHE